MARPTRSLVRHALLALACSAALGSLHAQTPPAAAPDAPAAAPDAATAPDGKGLEGRRNQKIERIQIDDGGAKVDELRYGGQTQSITVTPKGRMPAYEVKPSDPNRTQSQGQGDAAGGGTGPTLWNVLKF